MQNHLPRVEVVKDFSCFGFKLSLSDILFVLLDNSKWDIPVIQKLPYSEYVNVFSIWISFF
jgi:hypothetical protein